MKQKTIKTVRQPDGLILVSVEYLTTSARLWKIERAKRLLETTTGCLFLEVYAEPVTGTKDTWSLNGIMNPNGSDQAILKSLALFRKYAEQINRALYCINLDGLKEPTSPSSRPASKRAVKKP